MYIYIQSSGWGGRYGELVIIDYVYGQGRQAHELTLEVCRFPIWAVLQSTECVASVLRPPSPFFLFFILPSAALLSCVSV